MMPSRQLNIHSSAVLLWSSLRKDEIWQVEATKTPTLQRKRHRFEKGYIYPIKVIHTIYESEIVTCTWPKLLLVKLTAGSEVIGLTIDIQDDVHTCTLHVSAEPDESCSQGFVEQVSADLSNWLDYLVAELKSDAEKTAALGF